MTPTPSEPRGALAPRPAAFDCEDCIGMKEHGCYCAAMGATQPGDMGPGEQDTRRTPGASSDG